MNQIVALRWTTRILGGAIFSVALLFYFGYGIPLPFLKPEYSAHDNAWLCAFPLIFAGLILGWFFERTGGWLIVAPILCAQAVTLLTEHEFVPHMLVPLAIGLLYLLLARLSPKPQTTVSDQSPTG